MTLEPVSRVKYFLMGSIRWQWRLYYVFVEWRSGFLPLQTRGPDRRRWTVPVTWPSCCWCPRTGNTGSGPSVPPTGSAWNWGGPRSISYFPPSIWPHRSSSPLEHFYRLYWLLGGGERLANVKRLFTPCRSPLFVICLFWVVIRMLIKNLQLRTAQRWADSMIMIMWSETVNILPLLSEPWISGQAWYFIWNWNRY